MCVCVVYCVSPISHTVTSIHIFISDCCLMVAGLFFLQQSPWSDFSTSGCGWRLLFSRFGRKIIWSYNFCLQCKTILSLKLRSIKSPFRLLLAANPWSSIPQSTNWSFFFRFSVVLLSTTNTTKTTNISTNSSTRKKSTSIVCQMVTI